MDELVPDGKAKVDDRELKMAMQLIDRFTGRFEPEQYEDTYRDTLCEIIEAKRKGKDVRAEPARAPEEPPDLMDALRASLEAAQGRRRSGKASRNGDGKLADLSKDELLDRARKADIKGRSQMSKDELVEALRTVA